MTLGTLIIAFLIGTVASIIGGIVGGILVGGKHIGNELAALMGGFYGPVAGVPGVIVGLAIIMLGVLGLLSGQMIGS